MSRREEVFGQLEMFDAPPRYRKPKRLPKGDSWTAYKGTAVSCDRCVIELYEGRPTGMLDRARRRLTQPDGKVLLLCPRHEEIVKRERR